MVVVEETGAGRFVQRIATGSHELVADEPVSAGGRDAGPSPYDLLLASLGACTAMTLRMYAERKGLPLEKVRVRLSHARVHAQDCARCDTRAGKLDRIVREIELAGELSAAQRERLLAIAERCPVHRTLHAEVCIESSLLG